MCPESVGAREQLEELPDLVVHECAQAAACSSVVASKASSVRIEYTSAAPAFMETATPQGFGSFFLARPMLACGSGVDGDAAVTAQGHCNSERDQFPRLGIEMSCFL